MGTLNSCLKSKSLYRDGNENFSVGTATMQGFRLNQEDAHKYTFSLKNHPSYALFGVFDGHGGEKASHFLEANILDTLNNLEKLDDENIQNALMLLDKKFVSEENSNIREQGSTCVFCLVKKSKNKLNKTIYDLTCFNTGDSRCLLLKQTGGYQPLSNDHKPTDKTELKRIKEAGGTVSSNRVDGTLAVSRAFGDYNLKNDPELDQGKQKVIALPDIMRGTCQKGDILLVCCDGIFENLQNKAVANFTRDTFCKNKDPAKTLSMLFDFAIGSGSSDNMTGVLVHFENTKNLKKGHQFVPGPFFRGRNDETFSDAYRDDAQRNGFTVSPVVRLVAFHQDIKEITEGDNNSSDLIKNSIMSEIKLLKPWNLSLNNLAFLINSLSSSILIGEEHLEILENRKIFSVGDLHRLDEREGLRSLGFGEEIVSNIYVIFSLWRSLPGESTIADDS